MHPESRFGNRVLRVALAFAAVAAHGQAPKSLPPVVLRPGLVITRSARIIPGTYRLVAPASLDSALVTIVGNDITVDFAGARLEGAAPNADPDLAQGVAIRINGGRNVRVLNATVRGYTIAVLARGTTNLTLAGNDFSYNWKPRLFSLPAHESLVDWLSFHHNEKDEWLRFGAAVYLADVRGGEFRGNVARQGMNGLLLVRTDSLRIHDNDLSFNSGLGVGLYRSQYNQIVHNRVEFNVRGYSHGVYRRGQDSADILLYEQSSHNLVAYNAATHGGDGLFLWAGQSTMDTGEGGANDNLVFGNDFSFAPTNAMEATFSRNDFVANRANGSDYGLWGGYSYNSRVVGNCFSGNRVVVAIEHGQENLITGNLFAGDSTAVKLWADSIQPSDWGYPKHRDTRNRDNRVEANVVSKRADDCAARPALSPEFAALGQQVPAAMRGVPASPLAARDRSAIVVDEWGPFDWQSPKLWPVDSTHTRPLRLAVLGPPGRWRVRERRGVAALSKESGRVGDTILMTPLRHTDTDWEIVLEYVGAATVGPRGERRAAGVPVRFSYSQFEPTLNWKVSFHTWADSSDPRKAGNAAAFDARLAAAPVAARTERRLDLMWYRPTVPSLPQAKFAVEATAQVTLPGGPWTLRTISDDGVRVWVDGTLVIDNWTPHESAVDNAPITAGEHSIRVLYYQVEGWTELRVEFVRGTQRSRGSAGPH